MDYYITELLNNFQNREIITRTIGQEMMELHIAQHVLKLQ